MKTIQDLVLRGGIPSNMKLVQRDESRENLSVFVYLSDIDDWGFTNYMAPNLVKNIHNKIWPTLKKLGYVIYRKDFKDTRAHIDYYPKRLEDDIDEGVGGLEEISISAATTKNHTVDMYGSTVLEIYFSGWL